MPQRKRTNGLNSVLNSLTGKIVDPNSQVGSRINEFASAIQETSFEKPARVFTIPTDDMKIISKGKTSISAKKGVIAVPTVTEKGTTLVLMGKSEISTETEEQEVSTKEVDGTTTIWVPPEEWDQIINATGESGSDQAARPGAPRPLTTDPAAPAAATAAAPAAETASALWIG